MGNLVSHPCHIGPFLAKPITGGHGRSEVVDQFYARYLFFSLSYLLMLFGLYCGIAVFRILVLTITCVCDIYIQLEEGDRLKIIVSVLLEMAGLPKDDPR